MIDGRNFLDQPIKNYPQTYDIIIKMVTGRGDGYTKGCLLDYRYFKIYYKLIGIDLSKQQKLDANPKAIQQISFTRNFDRAEGSTWFFAIEKAKESNKKWN